MTRSYDLIRTKGGFTRLFLLAVTLVVVACTIFIRLRLLDVPLERDEGEYAYVGQLIRQGETPYRSVYSMKLPGTHVAYALIMLAFGETPRGIHAGLLLVLFNVIRNGNRVEQKLRYRSGLPGDGIPVA